MGGLILSCLEKLIDSGLPIPDWLHSAFKRRVDAVLKFDEKSWSSIKSFGKPFSGVKHKNLKINNLIIDFLPFALILIFRTNPEIGIKSKIKRGRRKHGDLFATIAKIVNKYLAFLNMEKITKRQAEELYYRLDKEMISEIKESGKYYRKELAAGKVSKLGNFTIKTPNGEITSNYFNDCL